MELADVNVPGYAHREDTNEHEAAKDWLERTLNADRAYAFSDLVLSVFIRAVTHARVFRRPSHLAQALDFVTTVRDRPNAVPVAPGARHWGIFERLCSEAGGRGNLVPDADLAAIAIESGCELVSTDRDFARFPGLRWTVPGQAS